LGMGVVWVVPHVPQHRREDPMFDSMMTAGAVLERAARRWPDKEAVVLDDRRLTYAQLNGMANRLANGLTRLGVTRQDRVAVMLPNWPEFICAYYALAKMGVVIVPMNTRFRRREIEHIVNETEASVLIIPDTFLGFDYVSLLSELWPQLPSLRHILVVGSELGPGMRAFAEVMAGADEGWPTDLAAGPTVEDVLAIGFTSGTTGRSKGAIIPHKVPFITASTYNQVMGVTEDDTILVTLAASQIPVFGGFVLAPALAGMRLVLLPRFKAEDALQLVEKENVTYLIGVPTMWIQELAQLDSTGSDLSSLRLGFVAGAPCPPEVAQAVEKRMHCKLHIAFGMTETAGYGSMTCVADPPEKRMRTTGRLLPGMEARIVDPDHNPLPAGQAGEIALRGQALLRGYYKQPEATAQAIDEEGWFYTGDIAVLDEQGYLQIVGRRTDMILRGGYNVYAAEVESCLLSHPDITNAAVIGMPDPVLGETVHAYVIRRDGASLTDKQAIDFCRREIANYKVPDEIVFVPELPLSSLGKIQKYILREQAFREKQTAEAG
jgi:fatty-acyl-CoA synthase